jgi:hypothetical protein
VVQTAAFALGSYLAKYLKSLVVCAVICELVSMANSRFLGNLTGKFAKSGVLARFHAEMAGAVLALMKDSVRSEQGVFLDRTGNFSSGTGNFL